MAAYELLVWWWSRLTRRIGCWLRCPTQGMMRTRGQHLLMVDADGATKAHCLTDVMAAMNKINKQGLGIAIGSRAHLHEEDSTAKRKWYRVILMKGFHLLVTLTIGGGGIKDTQCGFKLFSR